NGAHFRWHRGFLDDDDDGLTAGPSEWVCGGETLPEGWKPTPSDEDDCDDSKAGTTSPCSCTVRDFQGSRYRFCATRRSAQEARDDCDDYADDDGGGDGDLVVITSVEEDDFVARNLIHLGISEARIGLFDDGDD